MRIDAHHHLWQLAARDQPWLPAGSPIRRDFAVGDLVTAISGTDVGSTVLVQVLNRRDETDELLRIAAHTPVIAGVVGWVDLTSPSVADEVPGAMVGVRHQVQAEPDPVAWLRHADTDRGLDALAAAGLPFDLMITPGQFAAATDLVGRHPDLRFVLDHCGKPPIASGDLTGWRAGLTALALRDNVVCKLSGLVTVADHAAWQVADLRPVVESVLELFGPRRLMFGSDWPVCLLAAGYGEVVAAVEALLGGLSPTEREHIWSGTARRVYRLGADAASGTG